MSVSYVLRDNYKPVLILSNAVVCVKAEGGLPKTVVLEVVVEEANDAVGSLAHVDTLIDKIVDLHTKQDQYKVGNN